MTAESSNGSSVDWRLDEARTAVVRNDADIGCCPISRAESDIVFAPAPKEHWAAKGTVEGTIRLWDLATGRELVHWQGHEVEVTALAFDPDGEVLISGSREGTVKLWNLPYIRKELAALGLDW
jgi:WD40 repeat protein